MDTSYKDTNTVLIKLVYNKCARCVKQNSYGPSTIAISYCSDNVEDCEEECGKQIVEKLCTKCNRLVYVDASDDEFKKSLSEEDILNSLKNDNGFEQYYIKRCFLCNSPCDIENGDLCHDCTEKEKKNSTTLCSDNCEISEFEAVRGASDVEKVEENDEEHLSTCSLDRFEYLEKKFEIDDTNPSHNEMALENIDEEDSEQDAVTSNNEDKDKDDEEKSSMNLNFIEGELMKSEGKSMNKLQKQKGSINLVESFEWKNEVQDNKKLDTIKSLELGLSFDDEKNSNPEIKIERMKKNTILGEPIKKFSKFDELDELRLKKLKELLVSGYLICFCNNCEPVMQRKLKKLHEYSLNDNEKKIKFNIDCSKCKLKIFSDDELNHHVRKIMDMLPYCECPAKPIKKGEKILKY